MRTLSTSLVIGAALSIGLLTGCEGTGPSTQTGAVTGGALGALAGGIIGNNSGHQTWQGAAIGGLAGAIIGGTIGNEKDHQDGTIYHSEAEATSTVVVQQIPPVPPAPAEVPGPQPTPSAVWVPGHYVFDGHQYVWTSGYWTVPATPTYSVYVQPHWAYRGDGYGYVWVRGYWR